MMKSIIGADGISSMFMVSLVTPLLNRLLDLFLTVLSKLNSVVYFVYKKLRGHNINPSCVSFQLYRYDLGVYYERIYSNTELLNCILWYLSNNIKISGSFIIPAESLGLKIKYNIPITKIIMETGNDTKDKDKQGNSTSKIKQLSHIKVNKHIYIDMILLTDTLNYETLRNKSMKITCNIYSNTKNNIEITKFYEHIKSSYDNFYKKNNPNPVMTLHYFGENDQPVYQTFAIDRHQTFDTLFSEHKQMLLTELDKLNNKQYFDTNGLKRKMGYLFCGQPGSGKTAFVSAIANYTKRIIISISLNKIKTNDQLRDVLYSRRFCGKDYEPDQIIILFDEFEKSLFFNPKPKSQEDSKVLVIKDKKNEEDKADDKDDILDEATFLGLLDGIYDQDGTIILATANDVSKLNTAFIRDGRLKLLNVNYIDNVRISEMIEYYTKKMLSSTEFSKIRNDKKIQSVIIKKIILACFEQDMSVDDIIRSINELI